VATSPPGLNHIPCTGQHRSAAPASARNSSNNPRPRPWRSAPTRPSTWPPGTVSRP